MSLKIVVSLASQDTQPFKLKDDGFVENLKITTTITNASGQPLTLVNDPCSVLSDNSGFQKFIVKPISESLKTPEFKGMHIIFSPEKAVERGNVISLDKSLTLTHDLSDAYKFVSGAGEYTFELKHIFHAVDSLTQQIEVLNAKVDPLSIHISHESVYVAVKEEQVSVQITVPEPRILVPGHYEPVVTYSSRIIDQPVGLHRSVEYAAVESAPAMEPVEACGEDPKREDTDSEPSEAVGTHDAVNKEPEFKNIDDFEKQIELISATQTVEECIDEAIRYLKNMPLDRGTLRYEMWFGKYDQLRKMIVQTQFEIIRYSLESFAYAAGEEKVDGGYAYGFPNDNTLYLCQLFWDAPLTGISSGSKVDVLISEFSHFSRDVGFSAAYGAQACKDLAANDPYQAILNPDSYAFFAVNTPWHE